MVGARSDDIMMSLDGRYSSTDVECRTNQKEGGRASTRKRPAVERSDPISLKRSTQEKQYVEEEKNSEQNEAQKGEKIPISEQTIEVGIEGGEGLSHGGKDNL